MSKVRILCAAALILSQFQSTLLPDEPGGRGPAEWKLPDLTLRAESLYAEGPAAGPALATGVERGLPLAAAGGLPSSATLLPAMSLGAGLGVASYLEGRAGPLFFINDFNNLNPGLDLEVAYGVRPLPFLSFEVYSGYLRGDDTDGTPVERLWGVPLVGAVKVTLPMFLLKPYGGVGAGGYYLHSQQKLSGVKNNEDDVVLGWNAFAGLSFDAGPVFLTAEGKYIQTDVAKLMGCRPRLEGLALLVGVGVRF
jgi:hypothetical protein